MIVNVQLLCSSIYILLSESVGKWIKSIKRIRAHYKNIARIANAVQCHD